MIGHTEWICRVAGWNGNSASSTNNVGNSVDSASPVRPLTCHSHTPSVLAGRCQSVHAQPQCANRDAAPCAALVRLCMVQVSTQTNLSTPVTVLWVHTFALHLHQIKFHQTSSFRCIPLPGMRISRSLCRKIQNGLEHSFHHTSDKIRNF